jgi:DNA-binding response OmpR family regulator
LVREALEEHGVEGELLLIGDGDRAIRYIQALQTQPVDCPDLVIIDLNLPKRTGHEVLQSMRQDPKCRHAPAIILSSSDASEDRAESMRLGANQYICKPLRLKEFLSLGAVFRQILEAAG